MAMKDTQTRHVKTTGTVFQIVETIQELGGASLADLSRELDLAKSTIHDHLSTLESEEYVLQEGQEYTLGLKFLHHGMFAKNQLDVSHVGQPVIEDLAEKTQAGTWIVVEENGRAVPLNKAMGEKGLTTHITVGSRSHLNHLASGKLIMAYLPDEQFEAIIDRHGLPKKTSNTITDVDELRKELDEIREQGVAINDREAAKGVRSIAAPILNEGEFVGAVCVSGPANRMTKERCYEDIKPLLLEATNEIELKLQYPKR